MGIFQSRDRRTFRTIYPEMVYPQNLPDILYGAATGAGNAAVDILLPPDQQPQPRLCSRRFLRRMLIGGGIIAIIAAIIWFHNRYHSTPPGNEGIGSSEVRRRPPLIVPRDKHIVPRDEQV